MTRDGRPGPDPLESTLAETGPTPPPSRAPAAPAAPAPALLPVIAPETYDAGPEVARGGMGRIYAARDRRLARTVAIKTLVGDSAGLRRRFEREALITARLQHPAIVPIYEAGHWTSGEPFYAMKLVAGRSLKDVLADAATPAERLALLGHVITVVDALAYAHGEGIVHRDLKPANVLVGSFGETVVIDWGLAKDLGASDDDAGDAHEPEHASSDEQLTQAGSVMGTPAYMPPEQAQGAPVDRRADVYALGAILYHVLSGRPPYSERTSVVDVLAAKAAGPPRPLAAEAPGLPPDLIAIVEKAMARDPAARYPSARELALELHRFHTGQLVATHRYTTWQLVRRFVRRHRAPLLVAAVMLATIVVVVAVSFRRVVRERDRATAARVALEARTDQLTLDEARASVAHDPGLALSLLRGLRPEATVWPAVHVIVADAWARGVPRVLRADGLTGNFALAHDGSWLAAPDAAGSVYLFDTHGGEPRRLRGGGAAVISLQASPDDKTLATGDFEGHIVVWDVATGAARELGHHDGWTMGLSWLPDGKSLVTSGFDGRVVVHDVATGGARELTHHAGWSVGLTVSADGRLALESEMMQKTHLWDVATGALVLDIGPATLEPSATTLSPDGRLAAIARKDEQVELWDVGAKTRRKLVSPLVGPVGTLVFSRDGKRLAVAGHRRGVEVWDLGSGERHPVAGATDQVLDAAFAPDGNSLALATSGGGVLLADLTHATTRPLGAHSQAVRMIAFSDDGRTVVSGSTDGSVRLWRVEDEGTRLLAATLHAPQAAALSADGRIAAVASMRDPLWIWDTTTGAGRALTGGEGRLADVALSPDAAFAATVSIDHALRLWDVRGRTSRRLGCDAGVGVRFAADGAHLAALAASGRGVCLAGTAAGSPARLLATPEWTVALAFAAGAHDLAAADERGDLFVWSKDGTPRGSWRAPAPDPKQGPSVPVDVAMSPDGARVAVAGADGSLRLWRVGDAEARTLVAHGARLVRLVWAADGASFASVDANNEVRRWQAQTGHELGAARRFGDAQRAPVWAAGGRALAAPSTSGELDWWDATTGERRALRGAAPDIVSVAISDDGSHVLAAASDGSVRLWWDPVPVEPAALVAWLREHVAAPAEAARSL